MINDNDTATVSIAATTDGDETGPVDGVFTVTLTNPSSTDAIVDYTVTGTASSGTDFSVVSGQVTILAGTTTATITIPTMVLGETALSFLGLGLRPPITSWGVLLTEAQNINAVALYPWLMLPVAPVIVVVLAFNFLGDGLRDAADPYARG